MITEDYVSFETAKLLKEKGFGERVKSYYTKSGLEGYMLALKATKNTELGDGFISRPTLQMVMKWLREVHNIDIIINVSSKDESDGKRKYTYAIVSKWFVGTDNVKRAYEYACEAGIRYCLEKLI